MLCFVVVSVLPLRAAPPLLAASGARTRWSRTWAFTRNDRKRAWAPAHTIFVVANVSEPRPMHARDGDGLSARDRVWKRYTNKQIRCPLWVSASLLRNNNSQRFSFYGWRMVASVMATHKYRKYDEHESLACRCELICKYLHHSAGRLYRFELISTILECVSAWCCDYNDP